VNLRPIDQRRIAQLRARVAERHIQHYPDSRCNQRPTTSTRSAQYRKLTESKYPSVWNPYLQSHLAWFRVLSYVPQRTG
jgi:hypothetical protein